MKTISRRGFLRRLAFATDTAHSAIEPHTLVCVFLRGGADTLNMIVPYGDEKYYEVRPTLAIAKPGKSEKASLKLNDFYAFHPAMSALLPAFHDGHLGVVQGVGSDNLSGSHFEAQDQLEHGESFGTKLGGGWLGRHLHSRPGNMTPLSAVAIGKSLPEALRGAPSASALTSVDEVKLNLPRGNTRDVARALSKLYAADIDVLGTAGKDTLDLLGRIDKLKKIGYKPDGGASYSDTSFGASLREVGRLVKADVGLEVVCIDHDNWDTHFFQGGAEGQQATNIEDLSNGLGALYKDLKHQMHRTTIVVMTEFGRRSYENSSMGTDHGRGFALMAIGEKVKGGRVIGNWAGLKEPGLVDDPLAFLGPSGLHVELDYRSVLTEVVRDLLGNKNTATVFPGFRPQPVGLFA
ncbi:MAG: DUF1501 domain-containing protein [Candidatus Melainabacteria bacterium]|nr:DUF1501 domain-containing protein [Candidatus Melainabacteria bacterium]